VLSESSLTLVPSFIVYGKKQKGTTYIYSWEEIEVLLGVYHDLQIWIYNPMNNKSAKGRVGPISGCYPDLPAYLMLLLTKLINTDQHHSCYTTGCGKTTWDRCYRAYTAALVNVGYGMQTSVRLGNRRASQHGHIVPSAMTGVL